MSTKEAKYLISNTSIKFTAYGINYKVVSAHSFFSEIAEKLKAGKVREAVGLYKNGHKKVVKAGFAVSGNNILYKGNQLPEPFVKVRNICASNKTDDSKFCLFLDNLYSNPSSISIAALACFLEVGMMPITDDGCFLAYKRVGTDFKDLRTRSMDNSPGKIVQINRGRVDSDQSATCSTGLHVCSHKYLDSYANRYSNKTIVVKINPRDVVAVPPDYGHTKMRVCEYKVLCELDEFKESLLSYQADVLGHLPYFDTAHLAKSGINYGES